MKISFNDKSLQTTFEYPPESSLQEAEAEEEEEEDAEEDAEAYGPDGAAEKPLALFLPRATFVSSVGPESPRLPDGSSGECPLGRAGRMGWGGPPVGLQSQLWDCSHMSTHSACRLVQLHAEALRGFQQVAGAGAGADSECGGGPVQGGHGEQGQVVDGHPEKVGKMGAPTPGRALDGLYTPLSSPPPVRTTSRTSEASQPSTSDLPQPDQNGQG